MDRERRETEAWRAGCRLSRWTNRTSLSPSVGPSGVTASESRAESCFSNWGRSSRNQDLSTWHDLTGDNTEKHTIEQNSSWKCDRNHFQDSFGGERYLLQIFGFLSLSLKRYEQKFHLCRRVYALSFFVVGHLSLCVHARVQPKVKGALAEEKRSSLTVSVFFVFF